MPKESLSKSINGEVITFYIVESIFDRMKKIFLIFLSGFICTFENFGTMVAFNASFFSFFCFI